MFVFREAGGSESTSIGRVDEQTQSEAAARDRATILKVSVPTPFGWYYMNIRFGQERRSVDRLIREGQLSLKKLSLSYTVALWVVFGLICLGVMVALYIMKSLAGIDLFHGTSFLHNFLYPPQVT